MTYLDPNRLLACGHPLLQFGSVDMPMTKFHNFNDKQNTWELQHSFEMQKLLRKV